MNEIVYLVQTQFENLPPISITDLQEWLFQTHEIAILQDTLRHIISNFGLIRAVKGIPQEAARLFSDPSSIDEFYNLFEEIINDYKILPSSQTQTKLEYQTMLTILVYK